MSAFRRSDDWRTSYRSDDASAKRQKTANGYLPTNSHADILSDDLEIPSSPPASSYVTQPTQLLDSTNRAPPPAEQSAPVVQVLASSPFQPKTIDVSHGRTGPAPGRLSSLMAPAGTEFKRPAGVVSAPSKSKEPLDISDGEGPKFRAISSDEDEEEFTKSDIKPSSFVAKNKTINSFGQRSGTTSRAQIDLTAFVYDPKKTASSKSEGTTNVAQKSQANQSKPERPKAVEDIDLEDILDEELRVKSKRLKTIYPEASVLLCRDTLLRFNENFDDAAQALADKFINLSSDDESEAPAPPPKPVEKSFPQDMKRQLKQPVKSIQERWASTQNATSRKGPESPEKAASKPRRRLMRGRKARSPELEEIEILSSSPPPAPKPTTVGRSKQPILVEDDDDDDDSAIASASEREGPEANGDLLEWLNSCTASQLADLASIKKPEAEAMLATRPFRSLDQASKFSTTAPPKNGRKTTRQTAGEKILRAAGEMWAAYAAVDELVKHCNTLAEPLKAEMAAWGCNVLGASTDGEIELVSFDDDNASPRDSGIGTPRSAKQSDEAGDDDIRMASARKRNILGKPMMMSEEVVLKDYQIVGLNWLDLLYRNELSCILADDMGLGKTCQVISFLSHLTATGNPGPHLIIVPGSTLENWLREFRFFSPGLVVEPYYGSQNERYELSESMLERRDEINVVVTTYDMAYKPNDNKFLRRLNPDVCVYDEGHLLKNPSSQRYQSLVKIPATFRLLLTGTPLQNNLKELAALLSFILPNVFNELHDDLECLFKHKATTTDTDHGALLSDGRTARARSMLTPFVLRRKKEQVLKYLPSKTCRVEYVDLHPAQAEIYAGYVDQAVQKAKLRQQGVKVPKSDDDVNNPLMQLRKAAIHPQLFRRHFTDKMINEMADVLRRKEPENFPSSQAKDKLVKEMQGLSDFWLHGWCDIYPGAIKKYDVPHESWMNSGKVEALARLVLEYKANGERVLIFSQMALVLDILEAVLSTIQVQFTRIDGSTRIDERQTLIDQFRDDNDITVFLLTTRAGGTGLNLTYANKVIIFDSSFNPQDDIQAENRAHRLGQKKEVEVVRLVTKGTVEEQIYALGQSKLALDSKVAGAGATADDDAAAARGEELVEKLLLEADSSK